MDIIYHFQCDFPAVYLVNGVFFERASKLQSQLSDVLYVTVLPLDAVCLPYTVRLGAGKLLTNPELTDFYRLQERRFYVRFRPRYNYVYSPVKHSSPTEDVSTIKRFYTAVKEGKTSAARELMTGALSSTVDDASLLAFFDGYSAVLENSDFVPGGKTLFFLIPEGEQMTASLFKADYVNGLIDNISEV